MTGIKMTKKIKDTVETNYAFILYNLYCFSVDFRLLVMLEK